MKKDKEILIRISQELKEEVQNKAKKMGLSVSAYIRVLLIEKLKEQ